MKNMLEELNMQVLLEKWKNRQKNISIDSSKVLKGFEGTESHRGSMAHDQNEKIRIRHQIEMKHLLRNEDAAKMKANKDLKAMREEFESMLAYGFVYKAHSFKNYDQWKNEIRTKYKKNKKDDASLPPKPPPSYRPLGSLRKSGKEKWSHEDYLKLPRLPPKGIIEVSTTEKSDGKNVESGSRPGSLDVDISRPVFPRIELALGVSAKYSREIIEDNHESDSETALSKDRYSSNLVELRPKSAALGLVDGFYKWKQEEMKQQMSQKPSSEPIRDSWRRVLPKPPTRPRPIFPGQCRTPYALKKFYEKEVNSVMDMWSPEKQRKELVEKIKEMETNNQQHTFIQRSKSTVAMLDEYKRYIEELNNELFRPESDKETPMIIRQCTSFERDSRPKSQTRVGSFSTRISSAKTSTTDQSNLVLSGGVPVTDEEIGLAQRQEEIQTQIGKLYKKLLVLQKPPTVPPSTPTSKPAKPTESTPTLKLAKLTESNLKLLSSKPPQGRRGKRPHPKSKRSTLISDKDSITTTFSMTTDSSIYDRFARSRPTSTTPARYLEPLPVKKSDAAQTRMIQIAVKIPDHIQLSKPEKEKPQKTTKGLPKSRKRPRPQINRTSTRSYEAKAVSITRDVKPMPEKVVEDTDNNTKSEGEMNTEPDQEDEPTRPQTRVSFSENVELIYTF
ncbi:hypothetical protein CHS0354_011840 [Potamilus streckersoni]|uniref:Uncharacterized protein n=1 Tax=Potamilus streckersoni TaxID=2493646 RepID=A0AAE0TEV0_9BIVA|nr:hypothetical protein CHS0354_011840 [Potamilus streckersoni]